MPRMDEVFIFEDGRMRDRAHLWNVFSKTFPEFKYRINQAADRLFGRGWKQRMVQVANQNRGEYGGTTDYSVKMIDDAIRVFWDRFYTDHETIKELSGLYDLCQEDGGDGGFDYVLDNSLLKDGNGPSMAVDADPNAAANGGWSSWVERTKRPVGVKKGTEDQMAYSKSEV